jgi:hypothetical protein
MGGRRSSQLPLEHYTAYESAPIIVMLTNIFTMPAISYFKYLFILHFLFCADQFEYLLLLLETHYCYFYYFIVIHY